MHCLHATCWYFRCVARFALWGVKAQPTGTRLLLATDQADPTFYSPGRTANLWCATGLSKTCWGCVTMNKLVGVMWRVLHGPKAVQ